MKCGFLGAIAFLLTGASWVAAQVTPSPLPQPTAQPARTSQPAGPVFPTAGDTQGGTVNTLTAQPPMTDGPSIVPSEAFAPCPGGCVFYTDADFLLYRFRTSAIPATAQSVPLGLIGVTVTNTTVNPPGTVPATTTQVVTSTLPVSIVNNATFGNPIIDFASQIGGRIAVGFWVDREQTWGLEARGEVIDRGVDNFAAVGTLPSNPLTFNTGLAPTITTLVAPGINGGSTTLTTTGTPIVFVRQTQSSLIGSASNEFYSGELNAKGVFLRLGCVDFGGLVGFRYLRYEEEIAINTAASLVKPAGSLETPGSLAADTLSQNLTFNTTNRVRALNQFFGAQTGLDIDMKFGSFFLDVRGTLGLGDMHQVADIVGTTTLVNNDPAHPTPASTFSAGGLLSGPTDNGQHSRDRFAYVPEVNAKLGCEVTSWLRCWVGYDGLVIGHAASAPGSTVTNTLNTTVSLGGSTSNVNIAQPAFRFQDRDVWVQGATFGFEVRY
jgi:hypothetical protein